MSLDVILAANVPEIVPCECPTCGHAHTREHSRREWSANITHNLAGMADAAGIYACLWRPDEHGITKARQLIEPLREGLAKLRAEPDRFQRYNAKNGWGTYQDFVPWVARVLEACERYPDADVSVSR